MYLVIILTLLLTSPLFAERFSADRNTRGYESGQPKKLRVDTFDFEGEYPELEHINIDAKRKKNVEVLLTGRYPALEKINYEGSFGTLSGKLTGEFPKLSFVNILCSNCAMELDLNTVWHKSCEVNIRGADQDIILNLPKDIGLEIHTKVALKGKVIPSAGLKKKGKFGVLNKIYINDLAETAPVALIIHVELGDGRLILQN